MMNDTAATTLTRASRRAVVGRASMIRTTRSSASRSSVHPRRRAARDAQCNDVPSPRWKVTPVVNHPACSTRPSAQRAGWSSPWAGRASSGTDVKLAVATLRAGVLLSYDAAGERLPYLEPMSRVWRWFAVWGLDLLIVGAVVASAIGTVLRTDADQPDGLQLWFEVVAFSVVVLALCARRRLPFLAPAFLWVGCAALSFLDNQLVTTQPGAFLCGMGAAVLLGSLRRKVESRVGLAIVIVCSAVIVANDPTQSPANLVFTPALFGVAWLIGYALRDRAERSEAAEERALRAERERET